MGAFANAFAIGRVIQWETRQVPCQYSLVVLPGWPVMTTRGPGSERFPGCGPLGVSIGPTVALGGRPSGARDHS